MRLTAALRGLRLLPAALLVLLSITPHTSLVHSKADNPSLSRHEFSSEPDMLFYFDDTETVLLVELNGKLWRSENAGEEWEAVMETEGVIYLSKSPYDNNVAVALGERRKHWITFNRGKEWKAFETEEHPSVFNAPISWHADDSKKLLYHGFEDCLNFGFCFGKVRI
jgi:photosystem II stability/assembly factor-like uncharacterized protein